MASFCNTRSGFPFVQTGFCFCLQTMIDVNSPVLHHHLTLYLMMQHFPILSLLTFPWKMLFLRKYWKNFIMDIKMGGH